MSNRVITFHGATMGITEYDIPAIDVVIHDDEPLFLTATGVAGFDAEADLEANPVVSFIQTGNLQPVGGQEYNAPKLTLGVLGAADSTMTVQTTTNEQGALQVNEEIEVPLAVDTDQYEVLLGTANVARTYQVKVGVPVGAKLISADMYINPVRHRRG